MKTRSGRLSGIIMSALLLAMGGGLVYGSQINPAAGESMIEHLRRPLVATGIGAIMILSVVLRWIGAIVPKREGYIDFQSEDGTVGISIKAIQDFIDRVGKEFGAVKGMESKLVRNRDSLDVVVLVRVLSGHKIKEFTQTMQQRIRESIRDSLGIENIGKISIQVREIVGAPEKGSSSAKVPVAEEVVVPEKSGEEPVEAPEAEEYDDNRSEG